MILAFDTSSAACTAALFDDTGACLARRDEQIGRGHSERLVPMLAELLDDRAADQILVGVGPGSFTGIRVAVVDTVGAGDSFGAALITALIDETNSAQGTQGTYACYLIQTGYNRAGAPPWAAVPQWTSQTSLATVAVRLGVQLVQTGVESPVGTTTVIATLPAASTAGDLLVATLRATASATQSTGTAGWVFAAGVSDASANRGEIWYYPNNPGGITTATFTLPTGNLGVAQLTEWKNISTAAPLDKTGTVAVGVNNTTSTVSTSAAVTLANELAIVNTGFTPSGTQVVTPAAGWNALLNVSSQGYASQYRYDRPAGVISETLTATTATRWANVIATFK